MSEKSNQQPGLFPDTRWTLVQRASSTDEDTEPLGELCKIYWFPIYVFIRKKGKSATDAEDLTQGFFEHLLNAGIFDKALHGHGKLRSYLLASVQNFLIDEWRRRSAQKRGGTTNHLMSIEAGEAERKFSAQLVDEDTPESEFDRSWSLALLERGFSRLKEEYERRGTLDLYNVLKETLVRSLDAPSLVDIADDLGITPENARISAFRFRKRFRAIITEEIRETVSSESDLEEELNHFRAALQN